MYHKDLTLAELKDQPIHFVGIGGCGMSGLAQIAANAGAVCSGSDLGESAVIEKLVKQGIEVQLMQTAESVPEHCSLIVASAAIKADHPELAEAKRRGVPVVKYAQMLGQLMSSRRGIAIAGTHGKSTTTSLLAHVLITCGLDPSVIVGANCPQIGGGCYSGKSDLLLAEACEYDRSFHYFHPTHAVILNVEEDHLDIYSSLDEIVEAFAVFARQVDEGGSLLINHEMPHRLTITAGLNCEVESLGYAPQADWRIELDSGEGGPSTVKLHREGEVVCQWVAPIAGEHMAYNAAAAAITAGRLGGEWDAIAKAIESFAGLDRRMQVIGEREVNGKESITIIDDYGHHPTEIDTTLRALRQHYQPGRLICVFQPHQHSRTRFLMEQFAVSFGQADIVIVPHIYFVRDSEAERQAVRAGDLVDRLRQRGVTAMHIYPFEAIVEQLELIAQPGDLVVTMGAGDVWQVARDYFKGRG